MNKRREGGRGRKRGETAIRAFRASMPEINTTFCVLAGGRVHIRKSVCVCFSGEGGWCGRGAHRRRLGGGGGG